MSRILLLALLLIPLSGLANTVYRTTDAQGNVVFTDTPPTNATPADRIEIGPTNTARPPETPVRAVPEETPVEQPAAVTYTLTITDPANETSFPMGPGNFSVSVRVSPSLASSERLQLFLDGEPRDEPQQATTWDLTNVFRGQHDLTVGVIDASGATIARSAPVRVFVHRPSVNFKNRAPPPVKPRPPRPQPINN